MRYLLVLILASFQLSCTAQNNSSYSNLNIDEFQEAITQNDEIILIDVRTPEEVANGSIENALNIDVTNNNFVTEVNQLDKSKPVYVFCRSGARSAKASNILIEQGFTKVYNMEGGYMAWRNKY